jgi:hypothetical protein
VSVGECKGELAADLVAKAARVCDTRSGGAPRSWIGFEMSLLYGDDSFTVGLVQNAAGPITA